MNRQKKFRLILAIGFALSLSSQNAIPQDALPKGVIFFKSSGLDKPESAQAKEYLSVQATPVVVLVTTFEGNNLTIQRNRFVEMIEYPNLRIIQTADQIKSLNEITQKLAAAQSTYPLSVNVIMPRLKSFTGAVDKLSQGFVFVGGVWQHSSKDEPQSKAPLSSQVASSGVMSSSPGMGNDESKIVDSSGREYHNVKILSVDPNGLKIQHNGGILKLTFDNLPQELKDKYNYNKESSDAYAVKEAEDIRKSRLASSVRSRVRAAAVKGEFSKQFFGLSKDKSLAVVSGIISEYEFKTTTNVTARANALGGAGLSNVSTTTEKILKDTRDIKVIGNLEELRKTGGEVVVYPILLKEPSELFALNLELAVRYSIPISPSDSIETVNQHDYIRLLGLSNRFSVKVLQGIDEGYLVSSRAEEFSTESYLLKGFTKSIYAEGDLLEFFGFLSEELFTYTTVLNAQKTVRVLDCLSFDIE